MGYDTRHYNHYNLKAQIFKASERRRLSSLNPAQTPLGSTSTESLMNAGSNQGASNARHNQLSPAPSLFQMNPTFSSSGTAQLPYFEKTTQNKKKNLSFENSPKSRSIQVVGLQQENKSRLYVGSSRTLVSGLKASSDEPLKKSYNDSLTDVNTPQVTQLDQTSISSVVK